MTDLPIGGTTGHCHETNDAITLAARWIVDQGDLRGRAIVPEVKTRFGLTTAESCAACREATLIRARSI